MAPPHDCVDMKQWIVLMKSFTEHVALLAKKRRTRDDIDVSDRVLCYSLAKASSGGKSNMCPTPEWLCL